MNDWTMMNWLTTYQLNIPTFWVGRVHYATIRFYILEYKFRYVYNNSLNIIETGALIHQKKRKETNGASLDKQKYYKIYKNKHK